MLAARVVEVVLLVWWLVIMLKVVAEVHRFSVLKAMGSYLVIYLIAVAAFAVAYAATLVIPPLRGMLG